MEEALWESEKSFRDVAENAQEWVWQVGAEGKYTYASPIEEKLLGYKPDELLPDYGHLNLPTHDVARQGRRPPCRDSLEVRASATPLLRQRPPLYPFGAFPLESPQLQRLTLPLDEEIAVVGPFHKSWRFYL